jgi:hypothetical protein
MYQWMMANEHIAHRLSVPAGTEFDRPNFMKRRIITY